MDSAFNVGKSKKCNVIKSLKINESGANGKNTMQYFRRVTYHTCFNMVCADMCKCDRTHIPSKPGFTQFVADNADRDLTTLDGKSTFHGIGMLAVTANKEKDNSQIFRSFENLIGNFGRDKRQRQSNKSIRSPVN